MDVLSQVLSTLRMRAAIIGNFVLREPWGLRIPEHPAIPFFAVMTGNVHLCVEGHDPLPVGAGGFVFLPRGQAHAMASSAGAQTTSLLDALAQQDEPMWNPGDESKTTRLRLGGCGAPTHLIAGAFYFGSHDYPLTAGLPSVVHVDGGEKRVQPLLQAALRLATEEYRLRAPGMAAAIARLSELVFLQVLRCYWSKAESGTSGVLQGLADPRIRKSLEAMHRAPHESWTVVRLARVAGMSRSSFVTHFHSRVGVSPKMYLTRCRMQLAAERLAITRESMSEIAEAAGYRSSFAFAKSFRRLQGCSPGQYRRDHQRSGHTR